MPNVTLLISKRNSGLDVSFTFLYIILLPSKEGAEGGFPHPGNHPLLQACLEARAGNLEPRKKRVKGPNKSEPEAVVSRGPTLLAGSRTPV